MKLILLTFMLLQQSAFACWKVQATMSVNEDKVEINQKLDHDKTYSFTGGKHIFHVKIPSKFATPPNLKEKKGIHSIEIGVQEKKGIILSEMTNGKIIVQSGKEATMTQQDNETGKITTFIIKIMEI